MVVYERGALYGTDGEGTHVGRDDVDAAADLAYGAVRGAGALELLGAVALDGLWGRCKLPTDTERK